MSIKTLRKRIALVAVSALGVGLLSVAPASAAASAGVGEFSTNLVCAVKNRAGTAAPNDNSSPYTTGHSAGVSIVVPLNAIISLEIAEGDEARIASNLFTFLDGVGSVATAGTDPDAGTVTVATDGKILLTSDQDVTSDAGTTFRLQATTLGSTTIAVATDVANTATATTANSVLVTVVAACDTSTYSSTNSEVSVSSSATDDPADDNNVDVALSNNAGSPLYVRVQLNNSYGDAISTGTLVASATNGAKVRWGATGAGASILKGLNSADTVTPDGVDQVRVDAGTAAGGSTVVTIMYNGSVVATKTLTFYGEVATIDIVKTYTGLIGTSGNGGTTGFFLYQYKDAAGNVVPGDGLTVDATTVSTQIPTATSEKAPTAAPGAVSGNLEAGIETAIGSTTYGVMSFACGATPGTANITVETTNAVSLTDLSKVVSLSCFGGVDTYVVSTDKASYNIGEIATITITAKDVKGNPVADAATMGATETVSVGGGSLTKAVAAGDAFTGGVRTYKAQMTTAGTFNVVVTVSGTTTKSATAAYTVKDASAGVTNAEVLAAIVKLIASINKQIKALQKSLKR